MTRRANVLDGVGALRPRTDLLNAHEQSTYSGSCKRDLWSFDESLNEWAGLTHRPCQVGLDGHN